MSAGAVTTSIAGTCDVRFLSLPVILLLASLIWVIIILSLFIVYYKCKLNTTREALVRYVCIYLSVKDFVPSDKRPVVNWMKDPVTPEEFIQIINRMLKRMMLLPLFILPLLPVSAQGSMDETASADSIYVFRFVPQMDMFYIPYQGNGAEMNRLRGVLTRYIDRLRAGQMYVSVSSYAASKNGETSARRMGYLRNSRIKSELITRTELTERMFVTDRLIPTPYNDSLRDVVVVVFPAGVEKVRRIAGAEAAEKVEAYIKEVKADSPEVREAAERERRAAVLRAEQEAAARREEAQRLAQQQAEQAEAERKAAEAERQRLAAEESARRQAEAAPYTVALRANLLRWATLTPDLGVEWRISRHIGILVNGTWTSWSWDNKNRRYAFWKVSPEVRYYIGKEKRGYLGAMYHAGEFNYKLGDTGKQGDYQGGGITGGWQLPLNRALSLDFHAALGYTRADYDKYNVTEGVRVRTENGVKKNYWGINQLGVTLVWKPF
ncbi:DUF3575 domain-containing protein [Bacteroides fragilis]